jgi:hypothetical protein
VQPVLALMSQPFSSLALAKQAGFVHSVCDLSAHFHVSNG